MSVNAQIQAAKRLPRVKSSIRSGAAEAMTRRFGTARTSHKHRTAPRGGARNLQKDYADE